MNTVYLGIGTNIGNRLENLSSSVESLTHLPNTTVQAVSAVYETEPWGYKEQDNFYNICVKVESELSPNAMLGACLGIEAAFGRLRPFKNSPRIIDIDVLLYNNITMESYELTIPHPRISERAFVLVPLKDVLPTLKIDNINFNYFYDECDKTTVIKTDYTIEI